RAHRARRNQAYPRHPEPAFLHGDAASLAEQLAPVADAYDGRVDAAEHRLNSAETGDTFLLQAVLRDVAGHAPEADEAARLIDQRQRVVVQPAHGAFGVTHQEYQVAPTALFADAA